MIEKKKRLAETKASFVKSIDKLNKELVFFKNGLIPRKSMFLVIFLVLFWLFYYCLSY
jgi:hypothetical protein